MRKTVTIGDLGRIITGNTPPRNQPELYGNHTPFIKATDISESSKYTLSPEECYSEDGFRRYIGSLVPKGSTCVVTIGSIGKKMTMAYCDCFINQAMNAIVPNEKFNHEYVYYAVKNIVGNLKQLDSGTSSGRENVSKSAFSKMQITITDNMAEQEKIGQILSSYDSLIENNQKQIKLLEETAQRLYKEWFVDLRFRGHEEVAFIDGVPKGWEKKLIGEYLNVRSGYAFKSGWWQDTGYPVVKIKNIVNNIVDISGVDYVAPEKTVKIPEFKLHKGDIVIAMTGATIGKIGLVPEIENLYTNQRVGKVFPNDEITNPTPFVFCFYSQKSILEQIIALSSSSSAQPNISAAQLEGFEITANIDYINKFGKTTQPIFDKINGLYKQIKLLEQARDRLLPKLMSGELEV